MTKEEREAINDTKKACQHIFYVDTGKTSYDTRRLSLLINVLSRTESECDQWKARAEAAEKRVDALERVIKKTIPCRFCKLGVPESAVCYAYGWDKCKGARFKFDEARFMGGQ